MKTHGERMLSEEKEGGVYWKSDYEGKTSDGKQLSSDFVSRNLR